MSPEEKYMSWLFWGKIYVSWGKIYVVAMHFAASVNWRDQRDTKFKV